MATGRYITLILQCRVSLKKVSEQYSWVSDLLWGVIKLCRYCGVSVASKYWEVRKERLTIEDSLGYWSMEW